MLKEDKTPVSLSSEIYITFLNSIYSTIDNKDVETFLLLNSFIYKRLSASFKHDNVSSFKQFSGIYVWYYEYSLRKLKSSITYKDIYEVCADRAARSLKERVGWWFQLYKREKKLTLDEKDYSNKYSQILLNRFAEIINICLRNKDINQLSFFLNELQQSAGFHNPEITLLKWDIAEAKRKKLTKDDSLKLSQLEETYRVESFVDTMVRLLFKATLFWSYFLYSNQTLGFDDFSKITSLFERYQGYIRHEFLDDVLILRRLTSHHEYAWGEWDYIERLEGVVYTPPSPHQWATFGAILYSLHNKFPLSNHSHYQSSEQINGIENLINSTRQIIEELRSSGFFRWGHIFNAQNEEHFKKVMSAEIDKLDILRSHTLTSRDRLIAEAPIDESVVDATKNDLFNGWKLANRLRPVFQHYNKIKNVDEKDFGSELKVIGYQDGIWAGYKVNFVKDQELRVPIFGLENYGKKLIEIENNLFLSMLATDVSKPSSELRSALDSAIETISERGFSTSLIICGTDIWQRQIKDLDFPDFLFRPGDRQGFTFKNFGGTYKSVPIVVFNDLSITNTVIVCDFDKAFTLIQRFRDDAYDKVLKIEISEITTVKAEDIIRNNSDYWLKNLSADEAIVKVQNAMLIDFYLLEGFLTDDKNAYYAFRITD